MTTLQYIQKRINELHPLVFVSANPSIVDRAAYFAWHKELNKQGLGIDLSQHPYNPFPLVIDV